jgi:hypothetical protein
MTQIFPGRPKPTSERTKWRKTSLNKDKGLGLGLLPTTLSGRARIKKAVKSLGKKDFKLPALKRCA